MMDIVNALLGIVIAVGLVLVLIVGVIYGTRIVYEAFLDAWMGLSVEKKKHEEPPKET